MSYLSNNELVKWMKRRSHRYSKSLFLDVYARDNLPDRIPFYPCALIINTDSSNLPGKHWVAVYVSAYKVAEYFDSFDQPPPHDIALWMNKFSWDWKKVTLYPLQNPASSLCGAYVLYFVNERPMDTLRTVFLPFSDNFYRNDLYVQNYVKQHFKD